MQVCKFEPRKLGTGPLEEKKTAAAVYYQIPNTEHMAYRLVRTLVYKRGVGIREMVLVISSAGGGPKA